MVNLYFGPWEDPAKVNGVWYDTCDDGHPQIIYVAGLILDQDRNEGPVTGGCPACADATAARHERQEATGT